MRGSSDDTARDRSARGRAGRGVGRVRLRRRERAEPDTGAGARAAPGGKLTIGIAFDQPGLGLQHRRRLHRLRRRHRHLHRRRARRDPGQHHLEGSQQRPTPAAVGIRRRGPDRVHLLHHRPAQAGRRLRRALLRGPPGPARAPQRHRDHRARSAGRQNPVLGARHHLGGLRHQPLPGQHQTDRETAVLRLRHRVGQQRGRRGHHRRRHPRRVRRPTPVPRQAQGRRARASPTRSTASG